MVSLKVCPLVPRSSGDWAHPVPTVAWPAAQTAATGMGPGSEGVLAALPTGDSLGGWQGSCPTRQRGAEEEGAVQRRVGGAPAAGARGGGMGHMRHGLREGACALAAAAREKEEWGVARVRQRGEK